MFKITLEQSTRQFLLSLQSFPMKLITFENYNNSSSCLNNSIIAIFPVRPRDTSNHLISFMLKKLSGPSAAASPFLAGGHKLPCEFLVFAREQP